MDSVMKKAFINGISGQDGWHLAELLLDVAGASSSRLNCSFFGLMRRAVVSPCPGTPIS
jgi:GDP-D-mannose dehydratase